MPEIKVVPIKKQVDDDYGGFVEHYTETRYIIIDAETGETLDDAQGYGYKTAANAHRAWAYKKKPKKQRKAQDKRKKAIKKWLDENPEAEGEIETMFLYAYKEEVAVRKDDLKNLLEEKGLMEELPFSVDALWKYLQKMR